MGVGMYSPEEERAGWGRETGPLDSGAREGEARLRGVCSLGGETGPLVLSTKSHHGSLSSQLTQGRGFRVGICCQLGVAWQEAGGRWKGLG